MYVWIYLFFYFFISGKKQKLKVDDNQKTIDSMFKVVKRKLYYPEGSSSSTVKKTKNKLKTD